MGVRVPPAKVVRRSANNLYLGRIESNSACKRAKYWDCDDVSEWLSDMKLDAVDAIASALKGRTGVVLLQSCHLHAHSTVTFMRCYRTSWGQRTCCSSAKHCRTVSLRMSSRFQFLVVPLLPATLAPVAPAVSPVVSPISTLAAMGIKEGTAQQIAIIQHGCTEIEREFKEHGRNDEEGRPNDGFGSDLARFAYVNGLRAKKRAQENGKVRDAPHTIFWSIRLRRLLSWAGRTCWPCGSTHQTVLCVSTSRCAGRCSHIHSQPRRSTSTMHSANCARSMLTLTTIRNRGCFGAAWPTGRCRPV